MITPMKKYAFLVFHRDYDSFLNELGELGLLHVIERSNGERDDHLDALESRMERAQEVLKVLTDAGEEYPEAEAVTPKADTLSGTLDEVEEKEESIDILGHEIEELKKERDRILPWGNFEPAAVNGLKESGFHPYFFKTTTHQFEQDWETRENLFVINRTDGNVYFLLLEPWGETPEINAELEKSFGRSLEEVQALLTEKESQSEELRREVAGLSRTIPDLIRDQLSRLENEISILHVYMDTRCASEDTLRILEGWVPAESEEKVLKLSEKSGVICLESKPEAGESPPVKLRNKRFSRLFEPISNLFDLPSYGELDLTPYFAPFFMLFFGFCLGDAGYGVFFIIFAAILKLKAKKEFRPILSLTQYLGVATILFGLLSGTFFGVNLIDSGYTLTESSITELESSGVPSTVIRELEGQEGVYHKNRADYLAALEQEIGAGQVDTYSKELIKSAEAGIPIVRRFRHLMQDSLSMFYLAILIGGIQIIFGIFIRVFNTTRQAGFRYALPTVGWLILITALLLKAAGAFDRAPFVYIFYAMAGIAGVFIFILNKPGAGVVARIGGGIWDSYNMVTGVFGDLLSYIRLFALGISSAILGFVFNDISLQLLNVPYVGWLLFLILLLAGHSINLFLATLGGFIHPMRLTFVEFYKNAGFTGGGKSYVPFKLNNQ